MSMPDIETFIVVGWTSDGVRIWSQFDDADSAIDEVEALLARGMEQTAADAISPGFFAILGATHLEYDTAPRLVRRGD